jgi:hypothetical protein
MSSHLRSFSFSVVVAVISFSLSFAQEKAISPGQNLAKTISSQPYVLMNANNLTSWVRSDGYFPAIAGNSWNGEFPKGSGVGTVYQEGIVFGGKVHDGVYADSIRVTGDSYFIGMQAGAIKSDASGNTIGADDPNDPSVRAFGVRSDMPASIQYDTAAWPDLKSDAASFFQKGIDSVTAQDVRQIAGQYFKDWTEWPAAKGAPWFVDSVKIVRNDAGFDPTNPHDIPGIPDAAKTIWFVCNDENEGLKWQFAGSPPIGMEEQVTLWAYNGLPTPWEPLDNVIFKEVKLIYKGNPSAASTSHIDSMYVTQWVDGDIGDAGDDYIGCDSLLSLAIEYNSKTLDSKYAAVGLNAPADGYAFLQGASHYTGNPADSAIVNFQWRHGYRYWNDPAMSVFIPHWSGGSISDPDNGVYSGTLQWFNFMRGCLTRPAYPSGVPFWKVFSTYDDNRPTNYFLAGDPMTQTGWIDGIAGSPGDRRFWASSGPITLGIHDTAELAFAHIAAIGGNNLWSVQILKYYSTFAQYWFKGLTLPASPTTSVASNSIPQSFQVQQNYPNPFNPSTTIRYQLPTTSMVVLRIYNLLGQEVKTLVNGNQLPGEQAVVWDSRNNAGQIVSSGVYFFRIEATSMSPTVRVFRDVKKMVLIK